MIRGILYAGLRGRKDPKTRQGAYIQAPRA